MSRKKLTTYDYLACKGKRQLSNLFVHSADEAAAAEEAGIDFIVGAHDIPKFGINTTFDEVKSIGFQYFRDRRELYKNTLKDNKILILSQTALGEKIMNETLKFVVMFSDFQILYKLHPEEYKMYKKYPSYSKLASYKNIIFVEECNLYEIMSKSKIQIGVFSTALYEGLGLCCNTFLYNLNGLEYMQDVIDSEYAKVLSEDVDVSLKDFGNICENI